jgi:peptide/nickel transport system permease protein
MGQYLLRRFLVFIPTLIALTLLAFTLLRLAPGDPVQQMLGQTAGDGQQGAVAIAEYEQMRRQLGLHLPLFYVSVTTWAHSDSVALIPLPSHRAFAERLVYEFGNWAYIQPFMDALIHFQAATHAAAPDSAAAEALLAVRQHSISLFRWPLGGPQAYQQFLDTLASYVANLPQSHPLVWESISIGRKWKDLTENATAWKTWLPSLQWNGTENQYHIWLTNLLVGDFGRSYVDQKPVAQKVWAALKVTLALSLISVFITYLISIPLGIYSARNRGLWQDRALTLKLFVLYSLPSFWMAILLVNFFANPEHFNWFPASGLQSINHSSEWRFFRRLADWAWHLALPLVVYTYGSFAFLSRQVRASMLDSLSQDYIRTARAKGVPEALVAWRHGLRNALLPLITLFSSVFPALVSGSVILEYLFTLPGTGLLTLNAILAQDYPVVITVFTLVAILTMFGLLVADVLYALADPRISLQRK